LRNVAKNSQFEKFNGFDENSKFKKNNVKIIFENFKAHFQKYFCFSFMKM
jgi:hypothetical protein